MMTLEMGWGPFEEGHKNLLGIFKTLHAPGGTIPSPLGFVLGCASATMGKKCSCSSEGWE